MIGLEIEAGDWPPVDQLEADVRRAVDATLAALGHGDAQSELSVLLTDDAAIRELNAEWRGKDKATNVLSFPAFPIAPDDPLPLMLGDIVIAFETVTREAALEEKPFAHHFTHLLVHGLLHLLGHDHEDDEDAEEMEGLERRVLEGLAIPDPYR